MLFLADQVQVPHGVVEDHQHIWLALQSGQNLREARIAGVRGEILKRRHPLRCAGAGQVVHAEMERLRAAIGRAPLHRNRNLPRAGHRAQQHWRLDVVVIGDRDHRRARPSFSIWRLSRSKASFGVMGGVQ